MSNKEVWTDWNERQFVELRDRRDRIRNANRATVVEIAEKVLNDSGHQLPTLIRIDNFASALIDNADALNDALKPFDSGVRAAVAATVEDEKGDPSLKPGDVGFAGAIADKIAEGSSGIIDTTREPYAFSRSEPIEDAVPLRD